MIILHKDSMITCTNQKWFWCPICKGIVPQLSKHHHRAICTGCNNQEMKLLEANDIRVYTNKDHYAGKENKNAKESI